MLRELRALVAACLSAREVSRADLDVMLCLAESQPGVLPERVLALLHEADAQFTRHPSDRLVQIERLGRMLEAVQGLFLRNPRRSLTPRFEMGAAQRAQAQALCAELRALVEQVPWLSVMHRCRLLDRIAACEAEIGDDSGALDVLRGGASDVEEILAEVQHEDGQLRALMGALVALARQAAFGDARAALPVAVPVLRQVLA